MLSRTEFELSENMRDFMVAYDGNTARSAAELSIFIRRPSAKSVHSRSRNRI